MRLLIGSICLIGIIFSSITTRADEINLILNSPINKSGPSNNCEHDICKTLLSTILTAEKTIDFAIYGMRGQLHILKALESALDRGVTVRGIIDKDIDNKNYYTDTWMLENKFTNIRSDYVSDKKTLEKLTKKSWSKSKKNKCKRPEGHKGPLQCFKGEGYASKSDIRFSGYIMHNKFFIIDNRYVWTGSANISDTGTGGYNANNALFIDSKSLASVFIAEFERMYTEGLFHRAKKVTRTANSVSMATSPEQNITVAFSPQDYAVYSAVMPVLKGAKESIDIVIFFLTHKNIAIELVEEHKRGVKVRIIIDATGATNEYSKHQFLREKGIPVKIENWGGKMHMKSALVDGKHLITGSMNWTSAGESKNDENTLVIMDFHQAGKFGSFYNDLWASIDDRWLDDKPRPESFESLFSCKDRIDNDFDKKIDSMDDGCTR
ncbi:phospholipase D-like domain-containing protein [SAR92 clade bacterium H921]|nr:phospholipase D-like domain-containing protein [SAR92 clade bacterium H921]